MINMFSLQFVPLCLLPRKNLPTYYTNASKTPPKYPQHIPPNTPKITQQNLPEHIPKNRLEKLRNMF